MLDRFRLRLTLGYVGILAVILLLFFFATVVLFRDQTLDRQDAVLVHEAEQIARRRADGVGRDETMDESDAYGYVVLGGDGGEVERDASAASLGLPAVEAAAAAVRRGETVVRTEDGPEGGVRVASVPALRAGGEGEITQVATPLELALEPVSRLALVLVPIGLGALALAAGGGLFLSRRAIRPVQAAFERQRAFVADASHELKTPLALIKVDAEVLLRNPAVPDGGEILRHQVAEIDRMNGLLSDLLLLARLDGGKLAVACEPFDLAPVLVGTVDRFRRRASAAGVELCVRAPASLAARGDAERTCQIVSALLDNALRFTPAGGRVTVTGFRRKGRVEASVTDTGPGVDPRHLPRVFDRFFRAGTERAAGSGAGGGAGLGLAIARDLSRRQAGELTIGSGDGGGTEARLVLPGGD
ncbi:MAG: hypothetical protein AVDCRST_MAG19-3971 [uncultured Thermomicrobiales bacterium]|uniref:histidine kinase n=1 Tax=uncultured Thermomicrobiales bacterium TaxID=1645740 RepID=A0A6J4VL97_9BACT|nr:MAG: hypothetical protein AVDCRST_MAG19-3971 [uncultured Thermomicrobiales bacterium]